MLANIIDRIRWPHDGQTVIYQRGGELHEGKVIGGRAFTGQTPLTEVSEAQRLRVVVDAANGLGVPPYVIEQRLERGRMITYTPRREAGPQQK